MDRLKKEATGDLSGIKGTHYHLVCALYQLISQRANAVRFYAGNDLLAETVHPTGNVDTFTGGLAIQGHTNDTWIQCKASDHSWTALRLTNDVLLNFALNSLKSSAEGKLAEFELMTPGSIDTARIKKFVKEPTAQSKACRALEEVAQAVCDACESDKTGVLHSRAMKRKDARELCLSVLLRVSAPRRLSLDLMLAEMGIALADQHGSSSKANDLIRELLGAMLQETPQSAQHVQLDEAWMDGVLRRPVFPRGRFDIDPLGACDSQVRNSLKGIPDLHLDVTIPRTDLNDELAAFAASPATVFVLAGSTDAGKTSALAHVASKEWQGRPRCWAHTSDLLQAGDVGELMARLFAPLSQAVLTGTAAQQALLNAAEDGGHDPIIIVDDARPIDNRVDELRHSIAAIAQSARQQSVKMVISVNDAVRTRHKPTDDIPVGMIYRATPERPMSYGLRGFDAAECAALARAHGPWRDAEAALTAIPADSIDGRRSARLATLVCRDTPAWTGSGLSDPSDLLASEARRRTGLISKATSLGPAETMEVAMTFLAELWLRGAPGHDRSTALRRLHDLSGEGEHDFLLALQVHGLISTAPPFSVAENQIASSLIADWLRRQQDRDWAAGLAATASDDPITHFVQYSPDDTVCWCDAVSQVLPERNSALCAGIGRRRSVGFGELGFVVGLARSADRRIAFAPACEALGKLAVTLKPARLLVERMFLEGTPNERIRGAIAVGHGFPGDPDWGKDLILRSLQEEQLSRFRSKRDLSTWISSSLHAASHVQYPLALDEMRALIRRLQLHPRVADTAREELTWLRGAWEIA